MLLSVPEMMGLNDMGGGGGGGGHPFFEDAPLVEFMYLTLQYLLACQVKVTIDDSGLCCCL